MALLLLLSSCAVDGGSAGGGAAGEPSGAAVPRRTVAMSAARLSLLPALRPFYDELEPYGDWVLAEPQGWVFRPRVNTVAWRPYQDGHWEPSYAFGWVWESNDPFGWITDHYGFWFYDDFQGWVWKPYGAWAPSWVAWVQVGSYVGWAPLGPDGATTNTGVQGGLFTYVPATALTQPGSAMHASFVNNLPDDGSALRPIDLVSTYHGVNYNAGPDLTEVLGMAGAERLKVGATDPPAPPVVRGTTERPLALPALQERTERMWTEARREYESAHAQRLGGGGGMVRPVEPHVAPAPPPAGSDSLRFRFGNKPKGPWGKPRGGSVHAPASARDTLRTTKPDSLKLR